MKCNNNKESQMSKHDSSSSQAVKSSESSDVKVTLSKLVDPSMVKLFLDGIEFDVKRDSSQHTALVAKGAVSSRPILLVCSVTLQPNESFTFTNSGQCRIGTPTITLREAITVNGHTITPHDVCGWSPGLRISKAAAADKGIVNVNKV